MAYIQKDGQGSLFLNKDKDTEQQPNMTGTITIDGKVYRLAAWTKATKNGEKWLSLSAQPKVERPAPSSGETVAPPMAAVDDAFNDAVPW